MAELDAEKDTTTLSQKPSAPQPVEGTDATHTRGLADSVGAGLEAECGAATVDEESGLVHGDGDNSGGGGGSAGASRAARAAEREGGSVGPAQSRANMNSRVQWPRNPTR